MDLQCMKHTHTQILKHACANSFCRYKLPTVAHPLECLHPGWTEDDLANRHDRWSSPARCMTAWLNTWDTNHASLPLRDTYDALDGLAARFLVGAGVTGAVGTAGGTSTSSTGIAWHSIQYTEYRVTHATPRVHTDTNHMVKLSYTSVPLCKELRNFTTTWWLERWKLWQLLFFGILAPLLRWKIPNPLCYTYSMRHTPACSLQFLVFYP